MSTSLRETLTRRAEAAGTPDLDLDTLIGSGEHRLRRRRLVTVLSGAAAVLVAVALALGGAALTGADDRSNGPVDHPAPDRPLPPQVVREIVWGDGLHGRVVHYGDRLVRTGWSSSHMTVTDDGLVWTQDVASGNTDRTVWFGDPGGVERIGTNVCLGHLSDRYVMAGTSGSLVAWSECADPDRPALVVYDTSADGSGRRHGVVARVPSGCDSRSDAWEQFCALRGLVGDHLYWTRTVHRGHGWHTQLLRYDLP
jgi:hypothetical protein